MRAVDAPSADRQPWANNQVLIAILVLVVIGAGLGLYFGLHKSGHGNGKPRTVSVIGPKLETASQLKQQSRKLGIPIYWAGPKQGFEYEFTRDEKGNLFVRYLPTGTAPGIKGANWLIVVTYPLYTYKGLKDKAGSAAAPGPHKSIIYQNPHNHKSVLVAFKNAPQAQIEVYDPDPTVAVSTASNVRPVRGFGS